MDPTLVIRDAPSTTSSSPTASCTTATPGKYGAVPFDACNANYIYEPNFAANCALAVLFGLTFVAHITQAFAWRKRFCWVVLMGASWEFTAFIMRTLGTRDQQSLAYVIAGQLFFLLAPLWLNAFTYMTVARIVYYALPDKRLCRMKATRLTRLFVLIDVACFLVQGAGGMMMSNTDTNAPIVRTGQHVYMGGVGAQLAFVLVFCGMMGRLYYRMRVDMQPVPNPKRVKALLAVTFAVLVLIVVRIIFRLAEFGPGPNLENPIITHEMYAIALDALPMLLAYTLLNVVHPGWVLRGPDSEFPKVTRAEKKQKKQEKKAAKRAAKEEKKQAKLFAKNGVAAGKSHDFSYDSSYGQGDLEMAPRETGSSSDEESALVQGRGQFR